MPARKIDAMHERFGTSNHLCKGCCHLVKHTHQYVYYKCRAYGLSASEATDWKLSSVACGLYNKPLPPLFTPVIELLKHTGRKQLDKPIDGQIGLFMEDES